MGAILLIGAVFLVVTLLLGVVVFAVQKSWSNARFAGFGAGATVIVYAVALLVVSVATPARSLTVGEWKCFDDWCASVTSVTRTRDAVLVTLSVRNQGRREQAPDAPRVWLVHAGHRDQVMVAGLASRVPGGSVHQLAPIELTAPTTESPRLLVTEGGVPSLLVIGDDNSPLYPQPSWPLS